MITLTIHHRLGDMPSESSIHMRHYVIMYYFKVEHILLCYWVSSKPSRAFNSLIR